MEDTYEDTRYDISDDIADDSLGQGGLIAIIVVIVALVCVGAAS